LPRLPVLPFVLLLLLVGSACLPQSLLAQTNQLLNINFGAPSSSKIGFAAIGLSTVDYWNGVTVPSSPPAYGVSIPNLLWSDGTASGVTVSLHTHENNGASNPLTTANNSSPDGMYSSFIYETYGDYLATTVSGLPPGTYDFYCYTSRLGGYTHGSFHLLAGATDYGSLISSQQDSTGATNWQEGLQYVVFRSVSVSSNQSIFINTDTGYQNQQAATINGLQIVTPPLQTAPTILTQPQSRLAFPGTDISLGVTAFGPPPLYYQWRRNGTNLNSATASSFGLPNAQPADSDAYDVIVTNAFGSVTSSVANVVITSSQLLITTQPANQQVLVGSTANFNVAAIGTTTVGYQWRLGGTNIPGATANSLAIPGAALTNAGSYAVVVTNASGAVTSAVVSLTVFAYVGAPTITTQPQSRICMPFDTATLSVQVNGHVPPGYLGSFPLTFTWFKDNVPVSGLATLNIDSFTPDSVGTYKLVVSNPAGSATSSNAVLSMVPNSLVYYQNFASGTSMQLSGSASAFSGGLYFPPSSGATTPSLDVHNGGTIGFWFAFDSPSSPFQSGAVFGFGGYGIGASYLSQPTPQHFVDTIMHPEQFDIPPSAQTNANFGFYSGIQSGHNLTGVSFAQLLISSFVPPFIITPPQNQTVLVGNDANFSVLATGDHSIMTYQWQFNGMDLPGATNSTLLLSAVGTNQAGSYRVAVTNSVGSTFSPAASLAIQAYTLSATCSDTNLSLHWPVAASGFNLQFTTNLMPPVIWSNATNTATTNGLENVVTLPLPATEGMIFYRISRP
jgi:hypothetical protein